MVDPAYELDEDTEKETPVREFHVPETYGKYTETLEQLLELADEVPFVVDDLTDLGIDENGSSVTPVNFGPLDDPIDPAENASVPVIETGTQEGDPAQIHIVEGTQFGNEVTTLEIGSAAEQDVELLMDVVNPDHWDNEVEPENGSMSEDLQEVRNTVGVGGDEENTLSDRVDDLEAEVADIESRIGINGDPHPNGIQPHKVDAETVEANSVTANNTLVIPQRD